MIAQGQLSVLADRETAKKSPNGDGRWRALRESINPGGWAACRRAPGVLVPLTADLLVRPVFLSSEICEWIIGRAAGGRTLAPLSDPQASGLMLNECARNNSAFAFQLADMDVVMAMLCRRIAVMVGADPSGLEPPQVLHYRPGQRWAAALRLPGS